MQDATKLCGKLALCLVFGLGVCHPQPAAAQFGDLTKKLGMGSDSALPDGKNCLRAERRSAGWDG